MLTLFRKNKVEIAPFSQDNLALDHLPEDMHEIVKFVQITKQDLEHLTLIDDLMEEHVDTIAKRHYDMIMDTPEIKSIFDEFTTFERYISAITAYFKQLTKPVLDQNYVDYRKKIGKIHSRIELTEEWYIGSYVRVYEYLVPYITEKFA